MNDIIINKVQSIQRCIDRAKEEYALASKNFDSLEIRMVASIRPHTYHRFYSV